MDCKLTSADWIFIGVVALIISVGSLLLNGCATQGTNEVPFSDQKTCAAGLDEKCPSPEWLADFKRLKAMIDKYKMPKDEQDQASGIQQRLMKEIPAGYQWNEEKLKFVKIPAPAAPTTNQGTTPPPAPGPTHR